MDSAASLSVGGGAHGAGCAGLTVLRSLPGQLSDIARLAWTVNWIHPGTGVRRPAQASGCVDNNVGHRAQRRATSEGVHRWRRKLPQGARTPRLRIRDPRRISVYVRERRPRPE